MKKKITVIAIVACLLTILVGTSLAYFMDTDETTNTFTVGSVEIEQKEVFTQNSQLLPVINDEPTDGDNYIQKKVTVENTGKNDAYVQTYVAVPAVLDNTGVLKLWAGNVGWTMVDGDISVEGNQPKIKDVAIQNETLRYNLYLFRYNSKLLSEDPNAVTEPCLEYVYIASDVDLDIKRDDAGEITEVYFVINGTKVNDFNVATDSLNVYVATQAVQADGFTDAGAALDTAYTKHPWEK